MLSHQLSPALFLALLLSSNVFLVNGFCNWGPEGNSASSVCEGGAQGGTFCNADRNQCEADCGGKWCLDEEGFCNWGQDGTGASSVCMGGAQGGTFCNADRNQCEADCGGRWCSSSSGPSTSPPTAPTGPSPTPPTNTGGCGDGWIQGSWTTYTSYAPCCENSPNYDPNADPTECDVYSACTYTGQFAYIGQKSFDFVKSNNLIAFFSTYGDNASFGNKQIRISALGQTIEATVADTCGDNDCNGCCTQNAGSSGYLVDMEYWTVVNNFGSQGAANGQVC